MATFRGNKIQWKIYTTGSEFTYLDLIASERAANHTPIYRGVVRYAISNYNTTILYKICWDTCCNNHHYVHNQDIWLVYKMTCMIQYPCSKHVSSPSLPTKQCWYPHASYSFVVHYPWQHWFWGAGNRVFITKCPNSFVQDCSKQRRATNHTWVDDVKWAKVSDQYLLALKFNACMIYRIPFHFKYIVRQPLFSPPPPQISCSWTIMNWNSKH